MKHNCQLFIISWIFIVGILSCTKEHNELNDIRAFAYEQKHTRSISEAIMIAQNATHILDDGISIKKKMRLVKVNNGVKVVTTATHPILSNISFGRRKTSGTGNTTNNDTLLYIVNFDNNDGFAVVSARTEAIPLLAIADSGNYDPLIPSDNGGLEMFLKMARNYVVNARIIPTDSLNPSPYLQELLPLVNVAWGQHEIFYSLFTPLNNQLTGCANTAMAMVMSFFKYPQSLQITFPDTMNTPRPNIISFDWDSLLLIKNSIIKPSSLGTMSITLPCLLRELGERNQSVYHPNAGTSTNPENVRTTFINLGFTSSNGFTVSTYKQYNNNLGVLQQLLSNANQLILMTGGYYNSIDNDTTFHMWIVDGYKPYNIGNLYGGVIYNHINWGWDGASNGYYADRVFDVNQLFIADTLISNTLDPEYTHNYNINLKYFTVKRNSL